MPVKQTKDSPESGTVNVFGIADGYGLIWHGMRYVILEARPDHSPKTADDHAFYTGEPIVMNLNFPASSSLNGEVIDENGQPVADVEVSVNGLDYLDTEGKTMHHNFREFWGLNFLPEKHRTTRTDVKGKFSINGLPLQSVAWVGISHKDFARQSMYVAITDRAITEYRYVSNSKLTIKDGIQDRQPVFETKSVSVCPVQIRMEQTTEIVINVRDREEKPLSEMFVGVSSGTGAIYPVH